MQNRIKECIESRIELVKTSPKHEYECSLRDEDKNIWVTGFPVPVEWKRVFIAYQIFEDVSGIVRIDLIGIRSFSIREIK